MSVQPLQSLLASIVLLMFLCLSLLRMDRTYYMPTLGWEGCCELPDWIIYAAMTHILAEEHCKANGDKEVLVVLR